MSQHINSRYLNCFCLFVSTLRTHLEHLMDIWIRIFIRFIYTEFWWSRVPDQSVLYTKGFHNISYVISFYFMRFIKLTLTSRSNKVLQIILSTVNLIDYETNSYLPIHHLWTMDPSFLTIFTLAKRGCATLCANSL